MYFFINFCLGEEFSCDIKIVGKTLIIFLVLKLKRVEKNIYLEREIRNRGY